MSRVKVTPHRISGVNNHLKNTYLEPEIYLLNEIRHILNDYHIEVIHIFKKWFKICFYFLFLCLAKKVCDDES